MRPNILAGNDFTAESDMYETLSLLDCDPDSCAMQNGKEGFKYLSSDTFLILTTFALAICEYRQRKQRLLCTVLGGSPDGAGFEPAVVVASQEDGTAAI